MKILSIVGARPQFIKLMPLACAFKKHKAIVHVLLHTGQHYDYAMSNIFFNQLMLPAPDYHLGVGSGTHAYQTAEMLKKIEGVLFKEKPDAVLVFGDTNSTLAGALAAAKLHIPVVHVEAGLRSFNQSMPEEINRVVVDHVSTVMLCPTENAVNNLEKEGILKGVYLVGDVMHDAMLMCLGIAKKKSRILKRLNVSPQSYYLATVHRAENTDDKNKLENIIKAFNKISKNKIIIWPVHPRTAKLLKFFKIAPNVHIIRPVSYFDVLMLEKNAYKIITDSGGLQKEAYWLKVPCVTLRKETEWPETVREGFNALAGTDTNMIIKAALRFIPKKIITHSSPEVLLSADKILKVFKSHFKLIPLP